MLFAVRVVYLKSDVAEPAACPLRTAEAGCAWFSADGAFVRDTRLQISANSTHALLGHGVVAQLNELPLEGVLGGGCDVLIPQAHLDAARALLFEADRKTYGASYAFAVAAEVEPEPVEYRLRIDNREYQSTLSHLTFLLSVASREGLAVWIRI